MTARFLSVLSSVLLVLKCYQCQTVSAPSVSQVGQPSQITLPVVIKPAINYESSSVTPPSMPAYNNVPNAPDYNNFPIAPAFPPPLPPIIIDGGNGGGSNNWFSLLFLIFALRNNKGGGRSGGCGGCGGCGSCGGSGCGCGGRCGGGYGSGCGYSSGCGGYNYGIPEYGSGYSGVRYDNDFYPYASPCYGPYITSYEADALTIPGAEVVVTPSYIEDPLVPSSYYPTIQTLPSRDPYEVRLIVRTEIPE